MCVFLLSNCLESQEYLTIRSHSIHSSVYYTLESNLLLFHVFSSVDIWSNLQSHANTLHFYRRHSQLGHINVHNQVLYIVYDMHPSKCARFQSPSYSTTIRFVYLYQSCVCRLRSWRCSVNTIVCSSFYFGFIISPPIC